MSSTLENTPFSHPGKTAESAASGAPAVDLMSRVKRILWQRKLPLIAAAVFSAAVGVAAAALLGKPIWRAEGKLYHTPINEAQKKVCPTPDLETYVGWIKLDDNLKKVCEELDLDLTLVSVLKRPAVVKVEQPTRTDQNVNVTLDWEDRKKGVAIVNRLMELHIEYVRQEREDTIKKNIAIKEVQQRDCRQRLEAAQKKFNNVLSQSKHSDLESMLALTTLLERLSKDIENQEKLLVRPKGARDDLSDEIKKVERWLRLAKDGNMPPDAKDKNFQKEEADLENNIRKEESNQAQLQIDVGVKRREFERTRVDFQNKIATRVEFDKIKGELDSIEGKLEGSKKALSQLRTDQSKHPFNYLSNKKTQLEDDLKERKKDVLGIQGEIDRLAKEKKEIVDLIDKVRQPDAEVTEVKKQLAVISEEMNVLNNLSGKPSDFKIADPAREKEEPYSHTRKKIFILGFAIPLFLLTGLIVLYDLVATSGSTELLSGRLGLPVLGRAAASRDGQAGGLGANEARGLALRLRQYVPDAGGVILFSPLNPGYEIDNLVAETCRFLGMRDEKVLIVDARIAETQMGGLPTLIEQSAPLLVSDGASEDAASGREVQADPGTTGLVQYLVLEGQNPTLFIWPTRIPAVEYLPAGGPYPMTDVLASQPMSDLLESMRKKYTLLILVGPPLSRNVDTEILAAFTNGILVLLNGATATFTPALEAAYQSLKEANAPFLGAVVYE